MLCAVSIVFWQHLSITLISANGCWWLIPVNGLNAWGIMVVYGAGTS